MSPTKGKDVFFKGIKTPFLVIALCLMFLDYAGYGYYLFYLVLGYLFFRNSSLRADATFVLFLLFGISYGVTNWIHSGSLNYSGVLMPMINCPALYLAGGCIVASNNNKILTFILFLFALSLAFVAIISVLKDVVQRGFLVIGFDRNIPLIGVHNAEGVIAATGISSRLMLLASCIVLAMIAKKKVQKLFYFFCAAIAIYCALRVQSRTAVVCVVAELLLVTVMGGKMFSKRQRGLVIWGLFLFVAASAYVLTQYSDELVVLDRFQTDEIESGGGRSYRLVNVATHIIDFPFGYMPSSITYAHNLWLDCARVAGIIPFIFLVLASLGYAVSVISVLRERALDVVLRVSLAVFSLAVLVVFLAEPVLEGIPMVFEFFCLLAGGVAGIKKTKIGYMQ